jgi:uncharacterized protein
MRTTIVCAVATAALAAPAAAGAHVTVNPNRVAAGGFTVLDVRVPNERDNASTVKVVLRLPPAFTSASYEPVAGWKASVAKRRLAKPIQTPDGPITEAVDTITWTGSGSGDGRITPGQFRDFPISVQVPGKAGDVLAFKALQTYSNGEVVRWIGGESSDTPAARVTLTGAAPAAAAAPAATAGTAGASSSNGDSDGLAIAALVVGALGLLAGIAAIVTARRRPAR